MFFSTGGTSGITIVDGQLSLVAARFSVGNTTATADDTTDTSPFTGICDLSVPYTVSFCVVGSSANDRNFVVYVDNNRSNSAVTSSPHGAASKIHDVDTSTLVPGTVHAFTASVGSANSFLQLRTESSGSVVLDNLTISHGDLGSSPPTTG